LRRAPVPPPPPLGGGDVDAVTLNELVAHAAAMLDHSIDALVRAVADETAAAPAMETPREAGGDRPGASPMVTAGSALYFLSRLEHGALMPSVCYSIAVRAGEPSAAASTPREGGDTPLDGALSDWCAFLGAFYAAFWGALTTAPLRRPVYGTAMGRPPTPRSVANWLRAHFGPDAAPQLPIGSTRAREAWARAAGDVIEALWSRAGRSRVPDALPGRRSLLHHRAMCDPEAPYVLVLAALADPLGIETVRSAALYAAPAGDGRGVVRPVAIGRAIDIAGGARMVRAWSSPESAALLAPLRLPSRVGPDAREALWRMLVALATGDPAAASTASMLAEHDRDAEGSDDDHDDWMGPGARSAAEGVRRLVLLDDRARIARLLPAVPSHPSLRAGTTLFSFFVTILLLSTPFFLFFLPPLSWERSPIISPVYLSIFFLERSFSGLLALTRFHFFRGRSVALVISWDICASLNAWGRRTILLATARRPRGRTHGFRRVRMGTARHRGDDRRRADRGPNRGTAGARRAHGRMPPRHPAPRSLAPTARWRRRWRRSRRSPSFR
jgi:hypothetical protein